MSSREAVCAGAPLLAQDGPHTRVSRPESGSVRDSHVDGLRGVAILMVMIYHLWIERPDATALSWHDINSGWIYIVRFGYQGVSLFLVLSGYCLAIGPLRRRAAGRHDWLELRTYILRRALRILPPYYIALALFLCINRLSSIMPVPASLRPIPEYGVGDIVSHLLLIHNTTSYLFDINGSFWSLALECQWYLLFPLVLLLCLRFPLLTPLLCLSLSIFWNLSTASLWGIGALPSRLFEFCCGVVVAVLTTRQVKIPTRLLWIAALILLDLIVLRPLLPPFSGFPGSALLNRIIEYEVVATPTVLQAGWGGFFALLLWVAREDQRLNRLLTWRPLLFIGTISYSLYLVHQPILSVAEQLPGPLLLIMPLAAVLALLAGYLFYKWIEEPAAQAARRPGGLKLREALGLRPRTRLRES